MNPIEVLYTIILIYFYRFINFFSLFFIKNKEKKIYLHTFIDNIYINKESFSNEFTLKDIIDIIDDTDNTYLIEYENGKKEICYLGIVLENIGKDKIELDDSNEISFSNDSIEKKLLSYTDPFIYDEQFENLHNHYYSIKDKGFYPGYRKEWIKFINKTDKKEFIYSDINGEEKKIII